LLPTTAFRQGILMRSIRDHFTTRVRLAAAAMTLALFCAGGLGVSERAAAQDPPVFQAQAAYKGDFALPAITSRHQFGPPNAIQLTVSCFGANGSGMGGCYAEGTVTVQVSAAAKRKLGISSTTIGKGVLAPFGSQDEVEAQHMTVPANVRRKLKADYEKANNRCGNCGYGIQAAGTFSVTLTGPAGLPHETISAPVKISIGSSGGPHGQGDPSLACTTNVPDCRTFGQSPPS
jgi:hypothetical protein